MPNVRYIRAVLLVLCCVAECASAQHALVITNARAGGRVPVSVQAQVVDTAANALLPGIHTLPGQTVVRALIAMEHAGQIYMSTGMGPHAPLRDRDPGESYLTVLAPLPLHPTGHTHFPGEHNWAHEAVGFIRDASGAVQLAMLGRGINDAPSKIAFYDWNGDDPTELRRWGVPGEITDALVLEDSRRIALAHRVPRLRRGGVMLGGTGAAPDIRASLPVPPGASLMLQPLKLAQNGDALLVLGIAPRGDVSGESGMWVQLLDSMNLNPLGEAVPLPGSQMGGAEPLLRDGAGGFWVSTRSADTRFAHVTRVVPTAQGLEKTAAYSLPKTSTPVHMAQMPGADAPAFAVAYNNVLEIWPDGRRENLVNSHFSGPVGTLAWTADGVLLVGEVGRLHTFHAPFDGQHSTLQLQSGWVERILPLHTPEDTPPEAFMDSDRDGIPDALDPEPFAPSPKLTLPHKIAFRGEAAGQEVRAFRIAAEFGEDAAWRIEIPEPDTARWLRMAPLRGYGPAAVYLGVDPALYPRGEWVETWVKVHLGGIHQPNAYNSPQRILVQVLPQPRQVRQILWIWDTVPGVDFRHPDDPHGMKTLADLLAAAPHHFAHRETSGVVRLKLSQFAVVVVPLRALAQGQLIRAELMDYVLQGGAALILGDIPPPPYPATLGEWFRPAGVDIRLTPPLSGRFPLLPHPALATDGATLPVTQGVRFLAETGALAPLPEETGESALVVKPYGYGRLAFIADTEALRTPALRNESHLRFVLSCFRWLAHADADFSDMDGDLLVDAIEDLNNNGIVDPGETDFLNADTDGDGIPDGMEDLNRNGIVDPGETDPRNPDTNGNGIRDGADQHPYRQTTGQLPNFGQLPGTVP